MRIITPIKYFADNCDDWLAKDPPSWFSEAKKRYEAVPSIEMKLGTVKSCPSFVRIFRNSLVLKAPCDFMFAMSPDEQYVMTEFAGNSNFMGVDHHSLEHQIDQNWGSKHVNFKFSFQFKIICESQSQCMLLPPEYHFDEEPPIVKTMIGVLDLLPNKGIEFNLNMVANKQDLFEAKEVIVKKGTPLAYLYFPFGESISIEYVDRSEYENLSFIRTSFGADYLKQVMTPMRKSPQTQDALILGG